MGDEWNIMNHVNVSIYCTLAVRKNNYAKYVEMHKKLCLDRV